MTVHYQEQMEFLRRVMHEVTSVVPAGTKELTIEIAYLGEPPRQRGTVRLLDEMRDRMEVEVPAHVQDMVADTVEMFRDFLDPLAQKTVDGLPAVHASASREPEGWRCGSFGTPRAPLEDKVRSVRRLPDRTSWIARRIEGDPNPQSLPPVPAGMGHSAYFARLLSEKSWQTRDGGMDIKRQRAGVLTVRSGRVVVWDPFRFPPSEWAIVEMPSGDHPVWQVMVHAEDLSFPAAAIVACGRKRPVRWAVMEPTGLDRNDEGYAGVGVELACIGLMDLDGISAFTRDYRRGARSFHRHDRAMQDLRSNGQRASSYLPDAESGFTLILADTGSDGAYPVLAGYDDQGALACVAVDFLALVDEPDESDDEDD